MLNEELEKGSETASWSWYLSRMQEIDRRIESEDWDGAAGLYQTITDATDKAGMENIELTEDEKDSRGKYIDKKEKIKGRISKKALDYSMQGCLDKAIYLYGILKYWDIVARLYEEKGNYKAATENYLKAGYAKNAKKIYDMWVNAGDYREAIKFYFSGVKPVENLNTPIKELSERIMILVMSIILKGERLDEKLLFAQLAEAVGYYDYAALEYEAAGKYSLAGSMYEKGCKYQSAIEMYEKAKDNERAEEMRRKLEEQIREYMELGDLINFLKTVSDSPVSKETLTRLLDKFKEI